MNLFHKYYGRGEVRIYHLLPQLTLYLGGRKMNHDFHYMEIFYYSNNDMRRVFWLFDIVGQKVRLCSFHRLVTWIYWQFCSGIYHHNG